MRVEPFNYDNGNHRKYFRISKDSLDNPGRTVYYNNEDKTWMPPIDEHFTFWFFEKDAYEDLIGLLSGT